MLTLSIRGSARKKVPAPLGKELRRQVQRAMKAAQVADAEVCLSLTDDEELRSLNQAYADEDHATDVLSFSQQEGPPTPAAPGMGQVLGDVIISVETAERQAQAAGHDLLAELLHLAVHGLCHLLGHDHGTPAEERRMFGYEAQLRAQAPGKGKVQPVTAAPAPAPE